MISLPGFIIPETSDVGFHTALLLNLHCDDLDLVVGQADLDLEHVRHHKFIGLDRIKIMLLLTIGAGARLHHLPSGNVNLVLLPVTRKIRKLFNIYTLTNF
jgi:hypothetical protein